MKLNIPLVTRALSLPLWLGVRAWVTTLQCRVFYHEETVDPPLHAGPPRIYLFWHENIMLPLHYRGHCHVAMLVSQHRDADFLGKMAGRFGFECVRGSTKRGAFRALRELARKADSSHLTMTPDGPRGPRRVCAQGPIYLASKLQLPIVVLGIGYDRPWRIRSWDRFAVPRPFSRARTIMSSEIHVPPGLDREGIEDWRIHVEQVLNELTDEAEAWAESGEQMHGERPLIRAGAAPPVPRQSLKAAA